MVGGIDGTFKGTGMPYQPRRSALDAQFQPARARGFASWQATIKLLLLYRSYFL
jgi:hypothetical protein